MVDSPLYDVAVIGFGPTGATAANLLGSLGLAVVVIERDSDVYGRARAISTDEEVLRVWQSVGLAERLQRDMLPDRPVTFVDSAGHPFLETVIAGQGSGHPPQQFIYQPAVDAVLREGVARFDRVDVLLEHECLRVTQRGDHVELLVADLTKDALTRLRATYVIAADGGSSPTRGTLGVGYSGRTYAERWVVIDTKVLSPWDGHDRLRFHCDPARPTVDCPTPLGHHRWEFPAPADHTDAELTSDAAVWALLHDHGITPAHVELLRAVVYSHHVRIADRWRVGRVFLAGDAAHAMPPWIGQGMSAGVRDAANLCWKLAAVLRHDAPDALLDSYEVERKPHVTEVTRRAVLVGRLITERRHVLTRLRNRIFGAINGFPRLVVAGQRVWWIPAARYRAGFLAARGSDAVGWLIPQPVVTGDGGRRVWFDDLIGVGWAVLHRGPVPSSDAEAWIRAGARAVQVDEPTLAQWLADKRAECVVVRPDKFVYAAATSGRSLPPPPTFVREEAPSCPSPR